MFKSFWYIILLLPQSRDELHRFESLLRVGSISQRVWNIETIVELESECLKTMLVEHQFSVLKVLVY